MKLRELLSIIKNLALDNGISDPKLCGGSVRDRYAKLITANEKPDIDLTTGDKTIHQLAKVFTMDMSKRYSSIISKQMDDGHTSVYIGEGKDGLKIDFSSNFTNPNIDQILFNKGIKSPTDLQKEMFSRDFTCNALLASIENFSDITDPTHHGFQDINNKIIKTCLDPHITLSSNTNRIIRVIYLSAKLDFDVDPEIIEWITKHKQLLRLSSNSYLTKNINKAFNKNSDRAIYLLNKMDLWGLMPITEEILPFYKKRNQVKTAQLFRNYDYGVDDPNGPGTGFYANLDKYKSVMDFRKKKRKRRAKMIKKLRNMKLK